MSEFSIGSKFWKEFLVREASAMGISIDFLQIEQIARHCAELTQWNEKINLTAIIDPLEIAVKHVLDSMAAIGLIPEKASVLDIGSGGGFPGIVLKIVKPDISVTLIDASRKKISFLKHVIRSLGLERINALHRRAETLQTISDYVNAFDVVVSRSFAVLDVFVENAYPFLSEKGIMIAYKGKYVTEEIKKLDVMLKQTKEDNGCFSMSIHPYSLPRLNIERSLVVFRKQ